MPEALLDTEAVLRRIASLMAKTRDAGATPEETNSAMRVAKKLMDQYNVQEHQVLAAKDARADVAAKAAYDSITEIVVYQRKGMNQWDKQLCRVVNAVCGTKTYFTQKWGKDGRGKDAFLDTMMMYGFPVDLEVSKALFHELLATMRAMLRVRYGKDALRYEASYCLGFVTDAIYKAQNMKIASAEYQVDENTTAIVLQKDKIVERWAADKLSLGPARGRATKVRNAAAYDAGRRDGSNLELPAHGRAGMTPRLPKTQRQLPS